MTDRVIYAILRGEIGKPIELGLNRGIERLRGGFLLATLAKDELELMDSRFAVRAVKGHQALFGKAPRSHATTAPGRARRTSRPCRSSACPTWDTPPADG